MPCIPQKSKWEAARTIQLAHKLETNEQAYQNRTLPKKEFFRGKWREYGRRNNGKYVRLGKSLQERARLNTILWDFPSGEIILGVLEIPCAPQKSKWAAARTIQLAHKLETNEKPIKSERFPKKSSLEGNEGNMEEEKGNMTGYEDHYRKGPGWILFCGISQEKKLF